MKVRVSKVFANFINKTARELGFKCEAEVVTMGQNAYRMNVGTDAMYDADGDFDWETGEFKAIQVSYPGNYYACLRYLTTQELNKEFRRRGVTNADELKQMVREMCEI